MLHEMLAQRRLPALTTLESGEVVRSVDQWRVRRQELLTLLQREEYGFTPSAPASVCGDILESDPNALAGKALQQRIQLSFETPGGTFSFPFTLILPYATPKAPVFVSIGFDGHIPYKYLPAEEIVDSGYAIAHFDYRDVTSDGPEWDGLAACYPRDPETGWGKIGMWAFAASRIMDYLESRSEIDCARSCVSGHSRLGKTALWCGAQDERFAMVVSNDSGCSGAALSRGKIGENIDFITHTFPYWFCGRYQSWSGRESEMPFDQHMLLALTAPRKLYVCSAVKDWWADPKSEFLSCVAASEAWSLLRAPGLVTPDEMPQLNEPLLDGGVCYHIRTGVHYFSRQDWGYQIQCRQRCGL